MKPDLSPETVGRRLGVLRASFVPESDEEARRRLACDAVHETSDRVPFATKAARRLSELRALCELTAYLHRSRPDPR